MTFLVFLKYTAVCERSEAGLEQTVCMNHSKALSHDNLSSHLFNRYSCTCRRSNSSSFEIEFCFPNLQIIKLYILLPNIMHT